MNYKKGTEFALIGITREELAVMLNIPYLNRQLGYVLLPPTTILETWIKLGKEDIY